jgi:hypothetical protein
MRSTNPYSLLGVGFLFAGAGLAPLAYLILNSTPLTALGLSLIILGAVCIALGRTRPKISPEASTLLLETGLENISAMVEEIGLRTKAVYLPPSLSEEQPQALLPLHSNPSLLITEKTLPKRLIVKYGSGPEDVGILIATPGSAAVRMLESRPGPNPAEMENALLSIYGGMLDIASSVRVNMNGKSVSVEVSRDRMEYQNIRCYEALGSPLASIAATVAAEALDKPIIIESESRERGKNLIKLEVL